MNRQKLAQSLVILILVPAVVSALVTLLVLRLSAGGGQERILVLPTPGSTSVPEGASAPADAPPAPAAAEDQPAEDIPAADEGSAPAEEASVPAEGCQNTLHTVEAGQTLGTLAGRYGVTIEDIIAVNQLDDPSFNPDLISVGQQVIVPECGIPTATPTGEPSPTATSTLLPTATEAPAGEASVRISRVLSPGDVTSEALELINDGAPVDLEGWEISSGRGATFTFPSFRLFSDGAVTVFTGGGQDTPIRLYWGRSEAAWEPGQTLTLRDASGEVRDTFEVE